MSSAELAQRMVKVNQKCLFLAMKHFKSTFQKEKKILETKRLDLDSSKSRLRKAKSVASQTQVSISVLAVFCTALVTHFPIAVSILKQIGIPF